MFDPISITFMFNIYKIPEYIFFSILITKLTGSAHISLEKTHCLSVEHILYKEIVCAIQQAQQSIVESGTPNKKHLKNVGPIRHCEPSHAHSPDVATSTVTRRLRINVHNDNDGQWQRRRQWQCVTEGTAMAQLGGLGNESTLVRCRLCLHPKGTAHISLS